MAFLRPATSSSQVDQALEEAAWTVVEQTFGERAASSVRYYVPPGLLVRQPSEGVQQMARLLGVPNLPLQTQIIQRFCEVVGLPPEIANGSTFGEVVERARGHYLDHLFRNGSTKDEVAVRPVSSPPRPPEWGLG